MKKTALRKKIIEAGIQKLEKVAHDFQQRINELRELTTKDEYAESASQTEDRKSADIEMYRNLSSQMTFTLSEIQALQRINAESMHHEVGFGAVVITDKRNFFVSTGIEFFNVEGEDYFGLSIKAPLYKNMVGNKVGDRVSFHGIEYQIKDIF